MATRKVKTTAGPNEGTPHDFVYCGARVGAGGKKLMEIAVIDDNGALIKKGVYAHDNKARTIGARYRGARFTENAIIAFNTAKYTGKHLENESDVIEWTAVHRASLQELEDLKAEKDLGRVDYIEKLLLPLRIEYTKYHDSFDPYKGRALEDAVKSALRTPPRQYELEKKRGR